MLMKKQLEFRAKSGLIEKKLKRALRVEDYLEKQLMDINHRKKEASESILKLRKKYSEEVCSYIKFLFSNYKIENFVLLRRKTPY